MKAIVKLVGLPQGRRASISPEMLEIPKIATLVRRGNSHMSIYLVSVAFHDDSGWQRIRVSETESE